MANRQKPKPYTRTSPNRCRLITEAEMKAQARNKRRNRPRNENHPTSDKPKYVNAMTFKDVIESLKEKANNPPPPLSPEKQAEQDRLLAELAKDGGFMVINVNPSK